MRKLVITVLFLSLGLFNAYAGAQGQTNETPIATNADGSAVRSTAGVNPTANGGGGTIVYGDINTGSERTVIESPSIVTAPPPAPVATEPVAENGNATDGGGIDNTASAAAPNDETLVVSETDADADNYPDDLEWDLGLDPYNSDSDGDGVADGDELNIYGTDPTVFDTDGDGIGDGEELFGIQTDPLVWDEFTPNPSGSSEPLSQDAVDHAPVTADARSTSLAQDTSEDMTATDGNASSLGPGSASAAPGTVRRNGSGTTSLLGPDGRYIVSDDAPSTISVAGDTDVIAPPADTSSTNAIAGCDSYGTWYDSQLAYEAAGLLDADPAIISALDPDLDGIACEEGM
ncbi:MAG: hypothetical protein U0031_14540 [Thermomicrobiales bacterium]